MNHHVLLVSRLRIALVAFAQITVVYLCLIELSHAQTYPVLNTGYWVKEGPTRRLVDWIDDNRVLFVGGSYEGWDHNKINPTAIYVFDIHSKRISKLADGRSYCFKPTEIRYTLRTVPDGVVVRSIKRNSSEPDTEFIRTEAEIEAGSQKARARGYKNHPLYCDGYSPSELAGQNWERYHLIGLFPLLEGHGYLDLYGRHPNTNEPPFDTEPARWFPPDGGVPVDLPFPKRAIKAYLLEYSEWNNVYVLRGSGRLPPPHYEVTHRDQRWPKGEPFPVWLLGPQGSVERRTIPYATWIANYGRILPTRAGFLITRDINTRDAGLYLAGRGEPIRLVQGSTVGVTVSPDGCKVAVAITTDFGNRDGGLKIVSVCEGKGS